MLNSDPHRKTVTFAPRVEVARFTHLWEAEVCKSRLEAEGIEAVLADESLVGVNWLLSTAVGGVKVLVFEADLEAARRLLVADLSMPPISLVDEEPPVAGPRCPGCRSDNLIPQRWSRLGFVLSFVLLRVPLPIPSLQPTWRCAACGRQFAEEDLA